jgi:hypothetical protein
MAWRRHTRNLTKEVFYDGTTVDGSRLEKALGDIQEGVNNVQKGNTKQRFVATQYHAGFNPQDRRVAANVHKWPWVQVRNNKVTGSPLSILGLTPVNTPHNPSRFKGTAIPGIEPPSATVPAGLGDQYAWTRSFYFSKPVVLHGVSVLLHNDLGTDTARPYPGTRSTTVPAYTYTGGSGAIPGGFASGSNTVDLPIVLDVMNPGTPEDASMTDVEYTRTVLPINGETTSPIAPDASAVGWGDFVPAYSSLQMTDVRPLYGRLFEHRDLNIPIHERARLRLAIVLPKYDNSTFAYGSWGSKPWYLQAWSVTITVLEEVQTL